MKKILNTDEKELIADYIVQLLDEVVDISHIEELDDEAEFAKAELPVIEYAIKLLETRKKENEKIIAKAA
jgi:hypothetical protein